MFLISYRRTFTPQGSEALSSSLTTWMLMLVRSSNVRSSSILPISLRKRRLRQAGKWRNGSR